MSRGNIGHELRTMQPAKAGISTNVYPIFESADGIVLCYSRITSSATLTALVTNGLKFAPGCLCICVNSLAAATTLLMANYGTVNTAPNFYSVMTAGIDVGD